MRDIEQTTPLNSIGSTGGVNVNLVNLYLAEALTAAGSTFMAIGIFFYMARCYQWGMKQNFRLAMAQGICYIVGSLLSGRVAQRWGRRRMLSCHYLTLCLLMMAAALHPTVLVVCAVLLAYTFTISFTWPALESLISGNGAAAQISRRLGVYNLVWSLVGAGTMACTGWLTEWWRIAVFIIPAVVHGLSSGLLWISQVLPDRTQVVPEQDHAAAEPALRNQRRLALWLSRIALPATYVVVYGLSPMLPSLAVVKRLSLGQATILCSVWLAARCLAFLLLNLHNWWHTHPRALLWAAVTVLVSFLGTLLSGGMSAEHQQMAIFWMVIWQVAVGLSLGMIYSGSLYFGMVLSEGSTEHGGYHEALIGLGQVLGPGAGVVAQWVAPGNVNAGIAAVAGVIALSVIAAGVAAVRARH